MIRFLIFFLVIYPCSSSFAQCWVAIDEKGDTNNYALAIRDDHTLWDFTNTETGEQIGENTSWRKCVTTHSAVFLLAADSTLWGYGPNYYGALGLGHTDTVETLTQLNIFKWKDVSSSWGLTTAIKNDGTLWSWGFTGYYQNLLPPTQIGNDNDWKDIHSSGYIIALKNDNTLWFGYPTSELTQIGSDTDWNYIWIEGNQWWAIKENGTLWYNGVQVGTDSDWLSVVGHMYADTYGIKTNGTLWFWENTSYSLPFNPEGTPDQINSFTNCQQVSIISGFYETPPICCIYEENKLWMDEYASDIECSSDSIGGSNEDTNHTYFLNNIPQCISYQAVARNGQGNTIANTPIQVRLTLITDSLSGTTEYSETHALITNSLGLFNTAFGGGTPVIGTFTSINWVSGSKYLKVELNTGNGYLDIGTQQLLSVPFALRSKSAAEIENNSLPVFSDNAAAIAGGLTAGKLYRTSTGDLKVVY
jgi:hypothetical protein